MAPAKVLIIDDDADSITIYSLMLRHHGYTVIHAQDGETGLRMAFDTKPDLVVSELFLPEVAGGEVVTQLRKDQRTATTPLIVLDSIPNIGRSFADSLGEFRRLTKPCEPSRLLEEIELVLGRTLPLAG